MDRHNQWILKAQKYYDEVGDTVWMGKMTGHLLSEVKRLKKELEETKEDLKKEAWRGFN